MHAGKWKGTTVAVKILEHSAESSSGIKELREPVLSSSIIHPNVVSTKDPHHPRRLPILLPVPPRGELQYWRSVVDARQPCS